MKLIFTMAAGVCVLAGSASNAAILSIIHGAPRAFSVYLDGQSLNGNFDTVIFKATTLPAGTPTISVQLVSAGTIQQELVQVLFPAVGPFLNPSGGLSGGEPRPPGQQLTYINRLLNAEPFEFPGALGWTVLGLVNNPGELSFVGGPLGAKINTATEPGGRLFLANLCANVAPEPASLSLTVALLVPLMYARRRPRSSVGAARGADHF
jgi:hypothetical protein